MGLNMRTLFGVLLQLFCAVALFAADDRVVCRRYAGIPVALMPGGPVSDTVTGELCATSSPSAHIIFPARSLRVPCWPEWRRP
jgi:hypothetical protein